VEPRDLSGTTIAGKYLVKRRIGAGGMGTVYEGEHVEIGKRVAIKVIEHAHANENELAQRFRREARAASAVESEHIVHVFDVGQDPTVGLYMVMEFLSGIDLATRLERAGGALSVEDGVAIVLQTARGLAKAHAAGVVHRDLKPANLFLTTREDGQPCVKILDFGISKLVRPESDPAKAKDASLTREGVVIGTPQYMSPEQAQGMPVDARTDVWSLGVVAYEVLSGKPVFAPRDTYEQMIVQIVTTRPKPLADVVPGIAPQLAAIVDAALAHDAPSRPDVATLAQRLAAIAGVAVPPSGRALLPSDPDLHGAAHEATIAATPPTSAGVVVQTRAGPNHGARRTIGIGLGVGVVLVAGVLALFVGFQKPKPAVGSTGIVATPLPEPIPSAGAPPPVTRLAPLETAEPVASATASAQAAPSAKAVQAAPKARATAAAKAPPASPQYGAAGVSTSY